MNPQGTELDTLRAARKLTGKRGEQETVHQAAQLILDLVSSRVDLVKSEAFFEVLRALYRVQPEAGSMTWDDVAREADRAAARATGYRPTATT